ncbi:hypothetical protein DUNSADRAFT_13514 [Dunaliella salina]|uniref:Uncharacterized protein n=1 Tax=Dunaliella salina TaxID=3046 RepID=A0ABQ7G980_DUNSA|nr:hypothetical protein DUNSADRAFT_13514 [Dunaliella salina]|eukprot:KAF5831157.1 hypothetical protein DUNSADRAFT_13514 [Dunaliella salina]
MPPKKYNDEEAAQKTHGHLIAAAKKWAFRLKISCNGKQGQMLGGHNSYTNTMYVRCLCGDVKAHKAHESTPIYDLEDWVFRHCQGREADLEDMEDEEIDRACMEGCIVDSMDAVPGVSSRSGMTLRELVRLTCAGFGGPKLAGLCVWIYWYDQPHDAEDSVDAVNKGLAVLRGTEHKDLGVW